MYEKRFSLDVIGVAEPCHEDWSDMTGGEQKKFCDSCAKHVHNLSEMSRDEAERFVNDNPTGVCIRFRRDAATGKMLTADTPRPRKPAAAPATAQPEPQPHGHGRGRFSGPVPPRKHRAPSTHRRASHRMAGHVFVPFLSAFSLLAGAVAAVFGGDRAPAGPGCVMGEMVAGPAPVQQPKYAAVGVGVAPVPQPPAGFLAQATPQPPVVEPPILMGRIAPPVEPQPQIMGLICPQEPDPQPEPVPEPQPEPVAPELMGEIEFIMGDIACPEEPAVAVDPIEVPPKDAPQPPQVDGNAAQN